MGSLHQGAALDCYPDVCDQGQGYCYLLLKIEIQFPLNNFSLLWHIDTKLGVYAAWDCYPGVCDQGQGHCY